MHHARVLSMVLGFVLAGGLLAHAHDTGRVEAPLGKAKLTAGKGKVVFGGKWVGEAPRDNPLEQPSAVQISDLEGTDTGRIVLNPAFWTALKKDKGYKYVDKAGSVAGIRSILLKKTRNGGKLKLKGKGSATWDFGHDGLGSLVVNLIIGDGKWCADLADVSYKKSGKVKGRGKAFPASCPCEQFASTWEGILKIFERNGCQQAVCHGGAAQGGLDLRSDVAYANLVNVDSETGGKKRVQPGSRQDSFLWEKLAAATEGYDLGGRGSPMPSGLAPISPAELETIRLWIQFGAPDVGVVDGTAETLGACLPDPDPPTIEAPEPPPAGAGVQIHIPPWTIPPATAGGPDGEGEVCYAVYFDLTDDVPAEFRAPCPDYWGGPGKECFFFNKTELTQTPNSHHSILHIYRGTYDLTWEGEGASGFRFQCHGGAMDGQACDPRNEAPCGGEGLCHGAVTSSIACVGYGPPDYSRGLNANGAASSDNAPTVGGSQQPYLLNLSPPGVYGMLPIEGVLVANSHAFNLFDTPQANQQWWHLWFAPEEDRLAPFRPIFDATDIFVQRVPPFEEREYCRTFTMPKGTRVFEFSSHTHERGRLFRLWGPGIAESCRSTSTEPERCLPEPGPPILVTTEYNDPALLRLFDEDIHVLDSDDPADRRYKFCAIFDNGASDPATVKRNSTSPVPPQFGNLAPGGKCYYPWFGGVMVDKGISCLAGPNKGQECRADPGGVWDGDHSVCDSAPDRGDGVCDACPLEGGVTTDDEMFIALGSYYCVAGSDCEAGVCVAGPNQGQRCDGNDDLCPQSECGPYTN